MNEAIDWLQAKFPPAKLLTLLAPFILLGSAAASTWTATHFPGLPHFTAIQGAAFAAPIVLGIAAILNKRIDGWQKHDHNFLAGPIPTEILAAVAAGNSHLLSVHPVTGHIEVPAIEAQEVLAPPSDTAPPIPESVLEAQAETRADEARADGAALGPRVPPRVS